MRISWLVLLALVCASVASVGFAVGIWTLGLVAGLWSLILAVLSVREEMRDL